MTQQSIHDRIMSRSPGLTEGLNAGAANPAPLPRKKWMRVALATVLGTAAIVSGVFIAVYFPAFENVFAQGTKVDRAGTAKVEPSLPATPFLEHTKQAGIKTCGTVFPVLGQLLANGAQYNVQTQWHNTEPDKHAVQALVGMNYATTAYSGPAAGMVFASPIGEACEGTMVRIAPFPKKCVDVPPILPAGSVQAVALGQIPVYNLPDKGGQVLLLPSDQSCIIISVSQAAG
ncbi:hypothetical protein [Agrobacterium tumefaciens]|uniref:hypothetical protein n=1 Tax=Agrobacterium tumefaciens TaxID=358 RepID=UPI000554040B|nr:hypothetical protein [Agrobacterium tumefaciens]